VTPPNPAVFDEVTVEFFVAYRGRSIPKSHVSFSFNVETSFVTNDPRRGGTPSSEVVSFCQPLRPPATPEPSITSLDLHRLIAHRFLNPGLYSVLLEARSGCTDSIGHPKIEHDFVVTGPRLIPPGGFALPDYRNADEPLSSKRKTVKAQVVADASTHCVWAKDASKKDRHAVVWPRFAWAKLSPLRVYTEVGDELLREGETRDLLIYHPAPTTSIPVPCRTSVEPWGVVDVTG
jgi:hypothetical protein